MSDERKWAGTGEWRAMKKTRRDLLETEGTPGRYCASCESVVFAGEQMCLNCGIDRPDEGWPNLDDYRDPWLGQIIADRYLIASPVGHGTSGEVYRAESLSISRQFAIKIIATRSGDADADKVLTRLNREVEALSRLRNPHIVSFYDIFDLRGRYLAAVMDLIEGQTLEKLVADQGPMELDRACAVLRQTANGTYEAHEAGMIHRDLKPENLMVERLPAGDDFVHILDFGLVRLTDETEVDVTHGFVGTPLYASPEQAKGKELDRRSDIYSLGAILFYMLSGRPPFDSDKVYEVLRMHVRDKPPKLGKVSPREIPAQLEALVAAMLSKDRSNRPDDLSEVIEILDDFSRSRASQSGERLPDRQFQQTPASKILKVPNQSIPDEQLGGDAATNTEHREGSGIDSDGSADRLPPQTGGRQPVDTPTFRRTDTAGGAEDSSPRRPLADALAFESGHEESSSAATALSSAHYEFRSPLSEIRAAHRIDGAYAIADRNRGEVHLLRSESTAPVRLSVDEPEAIQDIALTEDYLIAGYDRGTIARYSIADKCTEIGYQDPRRKAITAVASDGSGEFVVAGSESGRMYVCNRRRGSSTDWRRLTSGEPVLAVALNRSTDTAAVARRGGGIELIESTGRGRVASRFDIDGVVRSMAFSPDDYLLAVAFEDSKVGLYRLPRGDLFMSATNDHVDVLNVDFSGSQHPIALCAIEQQLRVVEFEKIGSPTRK